MNTVTEKKLNSQTGGLAFSVNVVLYFAVTLLFAMCVFLFGIDTSSDLYLYLAYLVSPVAICITAVVISKWRGVGIGDMFKLGCSPKYYLVGLLLIFGLMFSLGWINSVTVEFFKLFGYVERPAESYLPDLSGGKVVLALVVMAVVPAVAEETLFRGIILNCTKQNVGGVASVLIVGFCFSLFHGSPEQTVYQFICGCLFALLVLRSGSTLPAIFIHFINNAFIVVAYAVGWVTEEGNLAISENANILLFALSAVSLVAAVVLLCLDKNKLRQSEKGGVKNFFLYASVGVAIMALVWIFSLFGIQ